MSILYEEKSPHFFVLLISCFGSLESVQRLPIKEFEGIFPSNSSVSFCSKLVNTVY